MIIYNIILHCRWHAYIDGIFAQYKQTLGPYKNEDLEFPGITINDVTVHAQKDPDFQNGIFGKVVGPKNQLFTHMELGDVGFYGADIGNITQSDRVRIKYRRLNHSPFVYRFTVTNSGPAPVDSIVRVFLADEKVVIKRIAQLLGLFCTSKRSKDTKGKLLRHHMF